jgi:copper(I)-binding protein
MKKILLLAVLISTSLFASACKQQIAGINTSDAYSFATASDKSGAAFVTISNSGTEDLTITEVKSPIAKTLELHVARKIKDTMQMRRVPFMMVPAGGSLELGPETNHIMLLDLEAPLKEGQSFPLTLVTSAGELTLDVKVKAAGEPQPEHQKH